MTEKIVQGNFKPHNWWQTRQFLIAVCLVVLTGAGGGLWAWHRHNANLNKKPAQPSVVNPVPTQAEIQQAQDDVTVNGTVQAFDGTTIKFMADGSSQPISVTVAAATTYSQGLSYTPATASGLKAGSRATMTYNTKTNAAVAVAYGQ